MPQIDRQTRRWLGMLVLAMCLLPAAGPVAQAQPAGKAYRIGHLGHGLEPSLMEAFRLALSELGYVEGRNLVVEYRYAEGRVEQLPSLAAELVHLKPDAIITNGTPAASAAQKATTSIPIVMVGIGLDPVQLGLVRSLARPGGNVTGIAALGTELWGKRLELFREAHPKLSRVAVLSNPTNPGNLLAVKELQAVAPRTGVTLRNVVAKNAGELDRAFAEIVREAPDSLIIVWDAFLQVNAKRIADFAIERQLPTLTPIKEYVQGGALMSYGANIPDQWRRAAYYVDKLLKGAKPADLPVEQPTKFDLIVNVKTAKALKLDLPRALLLRADQIME